MRISDGFVRIVAVSAGLALAAPAFALDGGRPPVPPAPIPGARLAGPPPPVPPAAIPNSRAAAPAVAIERPRAPVAPPPSLVLDGRRMPSELQVTPVEAFRSGAAALRAGQTALAVTSLQYAAEQGHAIAQWKLGRMYAEGTAVKQDDLRAFEYFRTIADQYADDAPDTPRARFVANAFVALGGYYLDGIPNTAVKADPVRAHEMFSYAAMYFGDPDAQYHLARLYLDGTGAPKDGRQAIRWFSAAAHKGQYQAQAMLGAMLFKGQAVPRQAARGLMWLTLARDATLARDPAAPEDKWIADTYVAAFKQATDDERALALRYLEGWLRGRRG